MTITVTLHESQAVYAVSALETQIDKIASFCRESDHLYQEMNNVHKDVMRLCLSTRDTLVTKLRDAGYPMTRIKTYDIHLREWQIL